MFSKLQLTVSIRRVETVAAASLIELLFNSSRVYMASVKQSRNLHQARRGLLNPDKALIPAIKY